MDEACGSRGVQQNRERLLNEEIAASFFARVLERARPFMWMNISRWTER